MTKLLFIWHLIVSLLATLADANPVAKNVQEFKILCRLLKIAEEGAVKLDPEEQAKKMVHLVEAEKLTSDFATVERKLSEASTFPLNLTDSITGENYSISDEGKMEMIRRIEAAKPIAEQLQKKMEAKKDEVKGEYEAAKEKFKEVIVGKELADLDKYQTEFKLKVDGKLRTGTDTARAKVCTAKTGENGAEGGYTIRTDLMCICAPGHAHTVRLCGFVIGTGASSDIWTGTTVTHLDTIWKIIYNNCEASNSSSPLDPDNIENTLTQFESLLGSRARDIANHRTLTNYVLGSMPTDQNTAHDCDGASLTTDGKGSCVNYSTRQTAGTTTSALNVTWRLRLIDAKKAIENAHGKAYAARQILRRLESLHHHVMNAALASATTRALKLGFTASSPGGDNSPREAKTTEAAVSAQLQAERTKHTTNIPFWFLAQLLLV